MALPLIDPSDVLSVVIKGRLFGQRTNNTFFYYFPVTDGNQTFVEFFSEFNVTMQDPFCNFISQDWTADTITIRRVNQNPTRGIDFPITWSGQVESDALPPSTAAVISRFNYSAGPNNRGRLFIPGVPTSFHSDGELTAPAMVLLEALAVAVKGTVEDLPDFQAEPGLWNRLASTFSSIEEATPRQILRQQRRREIGIGE